jgi:hypothetical protein
LILTAAAGPEAVLVAKANCRIPRFVDGAIRHDGTPEPMASYAGLAIAAPGANTARRRGPRPADRP